MAVAVFPIGKPITMITIELSIIVPIQWMEIPLPNFTRQKKTHFLLEYLPAGYRTLTGI